MYVVAQWCGVILESFDSSDASGQVLPRAGAAEIVVGASSDGGRNMNNDGKKKNNGKRGDGLWADHADFAIC